MATSLRRAATLRVPRVLQRPAALLYCAPATRTAFVHRLCARRQMERVDFAAKEDRLDDKLNGAQRDNVCQRVAC